MKKTVGFLGTGNIANAIMDGMVSSSAFSGDEIGVYDLDKVKSEQCRKDFGVTVFDSAQELAENCSAIVFAVKPNILPIVLKNLDEVLCKADKLIISVAAGTEIKSIEACLSKKLRIIRIMPNINAKVSEAISAICSNDKADDRDVEFAEKVFNSAGKTVRLEENLFSAFCAMAGSAPAFAYIFIDAIARSAVKSGAYKAEALKITSEMMLDKTKELFANNEDIEAEIEKLENDETAAKVISALKSNGFYEAIENAVDKTVEKDIKMKTNK